MGIKLSLATRKSLIWMDLMFLLSTGMLFARRSKFFVRDKKRKVFNNFGSF